MHADKARLEATLLSPLRSVRAWDPEAARRRANRLAADPVQFHRGAVSLHLDAIAVVAGVEGPWVWAAGDPHPGNFATLASGRARAGRTAPVTYDLADIDDEHPAPWTWDLARLLSGYAVAREDLSRRDLRTLTDAALTGYVEVCRRSADGDGDLGGTVWWQDLPPPVQALIEADSTDAARASYQRKHLSRAGRLRAGDHLREQDDAAATIQPLMQAALRGRGLVITDCRRRAPTGLSSLGRRRWLLATRDAQGMRVLEAKERRPSELSRLIASHDLPPVSGLLTVTVGADPYQTVVAAAPWPLLVRTRCHARSALDLADADADDLRQLARLHGLLLARFHLRGLAAFGISRAAELAEAVPRRCRDLAEAAYDLAATSRRCFERFRRCAHDT